MKFRNAWSSHYGWSVFIGHTAHGYETTLFEFTIQFHVFPELRGVSQLQRRWADLRSESFSPPHQQHAPRTRCKIQTGTWKSLSKHTQTKEEISLVTQREKQHKEMRLGHWNAVHVKYGQNSGSSVVRWVTWSNSNQLSNLARGSSLGSDIFYSEWTFQCSSFFQIWPLSLSISSNYETWPCLHTAIPLMCVLLIDEECKCIEYLLPSKPLQISKLSKQVITPTSIAHALITREKDRKHKQLQCIEVAWYPWALLQSFYQKPSCCAHLAINHLCLFPYQWSSAICWWLPSTSLQLDDSWDLWQFDHFPPADLVPWFAPHKTFRLKKATTSQSPEATQKWNEIVREMKTRPPFDTQHKVERKKDRRKPEFEERNDLHH